MAPTTLYTIDGEVFGIAYPDGSLLKPASTRRGTILHLEEGDFEVVWDGASPELPVHQRDDETGEWRWIQGRGKGQLLGDYETKWSIYDAIRIGGEGWLRAPKHRTNEEEE